MAACLRKGSVSRCLGRGQGQRRDLECQFTCRNAGAVRGSQNGVGEQSQFGLPDRRRSEEHTTELQSLMRSSYAVFWLKKKTQNTKRSNRQECTQTYPSTAPTCSTEPQSTYLNPTTCIDTRA